jgi:hypothetical protein
MYFQTSTFPYLTGFSAGLLKGIKRDRKEKLQLCPVRSAVPEQTRTPLTLFRGIPLPPWIIM